MNWLKDNPFLAGLSAVTLIGAGALAFLLFTQAMPRHEETSAAYAQAVNKLHELQGRVPYPSAENLAKSRELADAYKAELVNLHQKLAAIELPINPSVTPQQFQDDLRVAVNETVEKAEKAGTNLPSDFYLGFSQYSNNLPSEGAAPALARQLTVIKQIVQRLIDFKVHSIDRLDRTPLPQEGGAIAQAPSGGGGPGNKQQSANRERDRGPKLIERFPFDLAFTSEQSKFRVAFNSLLGGDQFLVVRGLIVQNSNPAGPPLDGGEQVTAVPDAGGAKNLNVILGKEFVQVAMRIEMLDFANSILETK